LTPDKQILESALLVVQWQRGDKAAFEGIVRLWEPSLFYYLRRLAPSEADAAEWLQETWLKVFKALRSLRDPQALPAFLYRTARNAAISHLRRGEFFESNHEAASAEPCEPGDPLAVLESADQAHHALEKLPLLQREVLTLFFLRELTLEQMAVLLGVPLGTVKSRLHYAKQAMAKILSSGESHDR